MFICRCSSPETVRKVWSVVSATKPECTEDQFLNCLLSKARSLGWTVDDLQMKLDLCVRDGLVLEQSSNGCIFYDIPDNVKQEVETSQDWYCFECHRPGATVKCLSCIRVYHVDCLPSIVKPSLCGDRIQCQSCMSCEKASVVDQNVMIKQLDGMLMWAHNKGGPILSSLPSSNLNLTPGQYKMLIAKHMDLTTMKTKVKSGQYTSPSHFLSDFQILVHNIVILYGKESNLALLAQELLKEVQAEIATIGLEMTAVPSTSSFADNFDLVHANETVKNSFVRNMNLHGTSGGGSKESELFEIAPNSNKKPRKPRTDSNGAPRKRKRNDNSLNSPPSGSKEHDDSQIVSSSCEPFGSRAAALQKPALIHPGSCGCDEKYRNIIVELQESWLLEYKNDKEKSCVDLTEKLHSDFENDQEKLRKEMLQQFKLEMESTKSDLDQKYTAKLQQEVQKLHEKHKAQISETKKKQWCWQCESEAIYHCCWNTSYCSVECQQQHWPQHRKYCRRKKQPQH